MLDLLEDRRREISEGGACEQLLHMSELLQPLVPLLELNEKGVVCCALLHKHFSKMSALLEVCGRVWFLPCPAWFSC